MTKARFLYNQQFEELQVEIIKDPLNIATLIKNYVTLLSEEQIKELCLAALLETSKAFPAVLEIASLVKMNSILFQDIASFAGMQEPTILRLISYPGLLSKADYKKVALACIESSPDALGDVSKNLPTASYEELVLFAAKLKSDVVKFIPPAKKGSVYSSEFYNQLYAIGIEKDWQLIKLLTFPIQESKISEKSYVKFFKLAIDKNKEALSNLPVAETNFLTKKSYFSILKYYVSLYPSEIEKIWQIIPTDYFTSKEYFEIFLTAVKKNGNALKFLTADKINLCGKENIFEVYKAAVKQSGMNLQYVPKTFIAITKEQYAALCMLSAKEDWMAYAFWPKASEGILTKDQYKGIFSHWSGRVWQTVHMIDFLNDTNLLSEEEYKKYLEDAVMLNGDALKAILDKKLKIELIETITPLAILSRNFSAFKHFPEGFNFETEKKLIISKATTIFVTDFSSTLDYELQEGEKTYMNHSNRHGKVIRVYPEDLQDVLILLQQQKTPSVKIVFLSHPQFNAIAGVKINEIINLLEVFPFIKSIKLLSCGSAQGPMLAAEEKINEAFLADMAAKKNHRCGFICVKGPLPSGAENNDALMQGLLKKLDFAFILIESSSNKYDLIYLKKQNKDWVRLEENAISPDQLAEMETLLTQGKKINFSTPTSLLKADTLTPEEWQEIQFIKEDLMNKLIRTHPDYKKLKGKYPTISSYEIDEQEAFEKLGKSFFVQLISAIKNSNVNRIVGVEAFRELIMIHPKVGGFVSSDSNIYLRPYQTTFFPHTNINEEKLKQERKQKIMKGESKFKKIITYVKPKS